MDLAELGFYKKKNGFEGAQDVLDFYKKTFKKTSPVETEVVLLHASAEGVGTCTCLSHLYTSPAKGVT
jgi:hypothetical protein